MNHKIGKFWIIIALLPGFAVTAQADYQVLHNFTGGGAYGWSPYGSLIASGPTLYGMTRDGGSENTGSIFKINNNGTGFQVIHDFIGGDNDGWHPLGSLIQSGSILYGMTALEGSGYSGTVFKINTDGSSFQILHNFAGGTNDGWRPYRDLLLSGTTLFGMTQGGGSNGNGVIFRINTDGTGFQVLHSFIGSDGSAPYGSLVNSDSVLYGIAHTGGANNSGVIFKINPDGTNYQVIRHFAGGTGDGANPLLSSLTPAGSILYGMTSAGGASNNGVIFKINPDGTGFQLLHSFAGGSSDGSQPYDSLILAGSTLYGMTHIGGAINRGTVFKIDIDGTGFQVLHSFSDSPGDGAEPWGSLVLSGATLYGMTRVGGSSNQGVIFALDIPTTCVNPPNGDLNGDCKVDFQDFAVLADEWLNCGLFPPEACN